MNLSLSRLTVQSLSASPLLVGARVNVMKSHFMRHFSSAYVGIPKELYSRHSTFKMFLSNVVVVDNENTGISHHIIDEGVTLDFYDTLFELCTANAEVFSYAAGGAIYATSCNVRIRLCRFVNNQANYAGALFCAKSTVDIESTEFTSNEALSDVGAVWFYQCPSVSIEKSNFTFNKAAMYCGACNVYNSGFTASECLFDSNEGKLSAGALSVISKGSTSISEMVFRNNSCGKNSEGWSGSDLFVQGPTTGEDRHVMTVSRSLFAGTKAGTSVIYGYGRIRLIFDDYVCSDSTSEGFVEYNTNGDVEVIGTTMFGIDNAEMCVDAFQTETFSASPTASFTPSMTNSFTASNSFSPSPTHVVTDTFSPSMTNPFTASDSFTPSHTFVVTDTFTQTSTDTFSNTETTVSETDPHDFTSITEISYTATMERGTSEFTVSEIADPLTPSNPWSNMQNDVPVPDPDIPLDFGPFSIAGLLLLLIMVLIVVYALKKKGKTSCRRQRTDDVHQTILIESDFTFAFDRDAFDSENFVAMINPRYGQ